jgi:uncharacterized protein (TIGR03083 family)
MPEVPPILVADLFPEVSRRLVELLRSLSLDEWHRPTASSRRTVKDVASHLLGGSLRRLSAQRDGYRPADERSRPQPGEPLVDFLGRLNGEWEAATRHLSPPVLVDLVEWADTRLAELFRSLDPHGPAPIAVTWAGEHRSEHWMDVAREYTEKWHHTQQIFDATGRPSTLLDRHLGHPCLDVFMRALAFTLRGAAAEPGAVVTVRVAGEAGGSWHAERQGADWALVTEARRPPAAVVTMDQDTAWRLVTKRRGRDAARRQFPDIRLEGDEALGLHVLDMVSVVA